MNAQKLYTISIRYFLIFVAALFVSGVVLFVLELGIEDMDSFLAHIGHMEAKSIEGIIEILSPHIMAMGLMLFTLSHFLIFSKKFTHAFSFKVFLFLCIIILIDQSAYLFIFLGFEIFGWVKVFSLLLFFFLLSLLLWMLALSL